MDGASYRTTPRFDLAAELVALDATSPSSYNIASDEIDLSILPPAEQNAALNNLIDLLALTRPTELPREPELWNNLRTFLKYFDSLQDTARSKVADGITSSFSQLIDSLRRDVSALSRSEQFRNNAQGADSDDDAMTAEDLRNDYCESIEMWSFLVNWLIYMADKVANSAASTAGAGATGKGRGRAKKAAAASSASASGTATSATSFPWTSSVLPSLLTLINKLFEFLPSTLLYPLSTPRDALLATLLRPTLHLFERESNLKTPVSQKDIKSLVFSVTCNAVKRHGQAQTAQTMLLQMLQYYEHLPEVIAQLLTTLRIEYDSGRLGEDVLVEISNRDFGSGGNAGGTLTISASLENKTPRVFARFLVAFAEANPRSTLKNVSLLRGLIDSEAYPIRNAMVEIFAVLIRELVISEDVVAEAPSQGNDAEDDARESSEQIKTRQIEGFWTILLERLLDVNSYVRVKVLGVFAKLCDLPAKFPAQRTKLLTLAQRALKDKSSSARKACITLLMRLILTHPYGLMHGGELEERVWQARVEETKRMMQEVGGGIELPQENEQEEEAEHEEDEGDRTLRNDADSEAGDETVDADGQDEKSSEEHPSSPAKNAPHKSAGRKSINTNDLASQLSPQDFETLKRLKLTHAYYSDALKFIQAIGSSMPILEDLLFSSNKGEALESMDFFRVAAEYKLPGAEHGMRRMVHLIWTKDNAMVEPTAGGVTGAANADGAEAGGAGAATATRSIRGRLIEVYMSLYFSPLPHLSDTENAGLIARNLVQRTQGATLAELTSLEELLSTIASEGLLDPSVVERLWDVYSARTNGRRSVERSHRRGAIIVLSMLAVSKKQIVEDKIDVLLGIGLGSLGTQDPILAKWTVLALSRVGGSAKKVKGALSSKRTRFPMHHPMFAKLRAAILAATLTASDLEDEAASKTSVEEKKAQWFSLAEVCISTIYDLGEQPDRLCADIIRWFMTHVFGSKHGGSDSARSQRESSVSTSASFGTAQGDSPTSSQDGFASQNARSPQAGISHPALGTKASAFQLAQLLFVVGHVALKQIVYLESVEREYKRRKAEAEKKEKDAAEQEKAATPQRSARGRGGRGSKEATPVDGDQARKASGEAAGKKDGAEDEGDELEQVAGNVEDEIGEIIAEVREKELLFGGRSLLALFGPMVVHVASNPKSYHSDHLRKSAVLTLCKFMCVSSSFCEANLSLLLHILSTSSDATTRSNAVIALGDIAVSFGTLVDENSDRLYAGLHDKDLGVKKHTLMVLTHLILNGMIKVKGQLGEMAKCIEDPETRVSDLAKLFFSELSTKENAVYNNLPDIISHLSIGKHAIEDTDSFQRTMRFIFTFVDKEKQAENVVEKLVQRFRLTDKVRQWRDIAFCLSLLPYKSERSVKKLIDGLPFYQDKLHDEDVYKRFVEIVAKARAAKTGVSSLGAGVGGGEAELQDYEQLLESFHSKGVEEGELEKGTKSRVAKAQNQARLEQESSQAGRGGRGGARGRGRGRGAGATRGSQRRRVSSEDEDEDGSEDNDGEEDQQQRAPSSQASPAKRQRRGAAAGKRRGAAAASDSDSESEDEEVRPPPSRANVLAGSQSQSQSQKGGRATRPVRGGGRKKVVVSEDEDDDDGEE